MMSANDPAVSFFDSVKFVKEVLTPLEVGIRQAAKFEHCWGPKNKGNGVQLAAQGNEGCKFQISGVKKNARYEKKKGLSIKVPLMAFVDMFSQNSGSGSKEKALTKEDGCSDINGLQFAVNWSLLVNGFLQSLPTPFKSGKKRLEKMQTEFHCQSVEISRDKDVKKEVNPVSLECLIGFISDHLTPNIENLDQGLQGNDDDRERNSLLSPSSHFNHLKEFTRILEGHRVNVSRFLGNLRFAKVGGLPSSIVEGSPSTKQEGDGNTSVDNIQELIELELLPQLGLTSKEHPNMKKLISLQDFYRYTEGEGRSFFEELDRDGDGQITLEDLEVAMRMRKLPRRYAHEFMSRAKSHLFSRSFGWKQFLSMTEKKEPTILRAYTSLCLSKSGKLTKSEILESFKNAELPVNEDDAVAMMQFLNADTKGSISYGHFRNFMLLLPSNCLQEDPRSTVVAVPASVEIPAESVLRSALAGGLSCALSCALMHPVDTIKTQIQASSTLTFPEIISKLPQIGARGLYKGSIPAILGQFSSHGLRTGISEASKLVLINVAPTLPNFQLQSISSFCSTFLGTAARIPCEVLKQQLQAGLFDNVGEALVGIWRQNGLRGFFRGTVATLCREVPFYVAGTGLYDESKKVAQQFLGRELKPWETVAVGALSGGLTAVTTTPLDVIKTRMMTAQGQSLSATVVILSILRHDGPLGLFKGAVPRFFWVAPLGAINFAGYELARKALNKDGELAGDNQPSKVATSK